MSVIQELEKTIDQAVKKIKGGKENDICRYIPSPQGDGYIHHFTMQKLKIEKPTELLQMINKYIMNEPVPAAVPPKRRAARGSRKRSGHFVFSKSLRVWGRRAKTICWFFLFVFRVDCFGFRDYVNRLE